MQHIDTLQKWLPLNYSFVDLPKSRTSLVKDNKFFTQNVDLKNEVSEAFFNCEQKNNLEAASFA